MGRRLDRLIELLERLVEAAEEIVLLLRERRAERDTKPQKTPRLRPKYSDRGARAVERAMKDVG